MGKYSLETNIEFGLKVIIQVLEESQSNIIKNIALSIYMEYLRQSGRMSEWQIYNN